MEGRASEIRAVRLSIKFAERFREQDDLPFGVGSLPVSNNKYRVLSWVTMTETDNHEWCRFSKNKEFS